MKLCLVNAFFPPFIGGTEKHMYELGRRLARTHEVHVVTARLDGTRDHEDVDGLHVWRVPATLVKAPLVYPPPVPLGRGVRRFLPRLHSDIGFDAFHLHGRWFPNFAWAVPFAREVHRPVAITLHNARPRGISALTDALGTAYDRLYGIRVIDSVDRAVAVCEFVRRDIAAYGIDPGKIDVIYNGVDTQRFSPGAGSARERLGGFDPQLLFLGRLIPQKNVVALISAMRRLVRDYPRLGLAVVGRGGQREEIRRKAVRWGLERNVVFPGFLEEHLLPQVYSSADVYALPSLWEVLPISLLEATACGIPAVVSDAGGNPEVVADGKSGLVFPRRDEAAMEDRLRRLIDDPGLRRQMGNEARRIALERFTWDRIATQTLEFYSRLVGVGG